MYHPSNKGFFPMLALRIEQSLSLEEKAGFESQKSLKDKIKFVNNLQRLNGDDPKINIFAQRLMTANFGEKSATKSSANRESGNAQFYAGNFRQAQILYSIAVFHAPQGPVSKGEQPHFALALANRSACLQKLHSYQDPSQPNQNARAELDFLQAESKLVESNLFQLAINDIDLALTSGYPIDKVFKLYERKGECLQQMAKASWRTTEERKDSAGRAVEAFRLSIKFLQTKSGLANDKVQKFCQLIQKKILEVSQIQFPENQNENQNGNGNDIQTGNDNLTGNSNQIQTPTSDNCKANMSENNNNNLPNENEKGFKLDSEPNNNKNTYQCGNESSGYNLNGMNALPMDASPTFPSAHTSIEIRYEPSRGRYAVAADDIPLGTTLIKEAPITHALHPERYGTHCQHCLKSIRCVIPCSTCSWVCFCSSTCRDSANASYHKYECGIMKLLLESGLNVYSFLTLRAVCSEGLESLLSMKEDLEEKRSETYGVQLKDTVYRSDDFRNMYNLVAHENSLSSDEWFLRTVIAIFLLRLLKNSPFFGDVTAKNGDYSINDDELFVGSVILRLINVCPCNCHDVSEFESPTLDKFGGACTKVSLGAGIFPTLALLNHSCDPSFMRCNNGSSIICVANKNIMKGEEISENYGLMYTSKDFEERQKILSTHYKFECVCTACVEKWPTLQEMAAERNLDPEDMRMNRFLKIRCKKCGETIRRKGAHSNPASIRVTCLVCGTETDLRNDIPLSEIKNLSRSAIDDLVSGKWQSGIEAATRCDLLAQKYLSLPILELTDAHVAIWKCMWLKFGTMKLVKMI